MKEVTGSRNHASRKMSNVTQILHAIQNGEVESTDKLLPLVYEELRKLAALKMSDERSDHTLQATALVNEAYLRLVGTSQPQNWDGRNRFFAAAAEAMRRILVDHARKRNRLKRGGDLEKFKIREDDRWSFHKPDELLQVHEALDELQKEDGTAAEIVKLHYFAEFSLADAANVVGVSSATAYRHWNYAKAWLKCFLAEDENSSDS